MRTCVVTGATNGIGFVTARELAKRGDKVIVVGRDQGRIDACVREIGAQAQGMRADFTKLDDVRVLAAQLPQGIDVLVNNAGVVNASRLETKDGFEMTFGVNHLAPFLLTNLVLAKLSPGARVVTVASAVHKNGHIDFDDLNHKKKFSPFGAYNDSKLANILFTRELARRLQPGQTANCLHPGVVGTNFGRNNNILVATAFRIGQLFMITPEEGAKTSLYLASSPDVASVTGKYFDKCREVTPAPRAQDDVVAKRLWDESAKLVGLAST